VLGTELAIAAGRRAVVETEGLVKREVKQIRHRKSQTC
jgi:hypothetical protein